ncbi:hypothetical protein KA977_12990, partial [Candidatus Dependentiae bacterium]|nr:hypothetical protein [Candidatus Dependentiae bacterium]
VMIDIVENSHFECAQKLKEVVATYRSAEDLINIGAYVKGTNPKIDYAIQMIDKINAFLKQGIKEKREFKQTLAMLNAMFKKM